MVPARTPRSKVKYSTLSSTDDGHTNPEKDTVPADADDCCKSQRCPGVARPHLVQLKESPARVPYKAIACFTLQFLVGAFLLITGCLLLGGYISEAGPGRAVVVLVVGILVILPGAYHLLVACRAHRGCEGSSYQDLPDCGD